MRVRSIFTAVLVAVLQTSSAAFGQASEEATSSRAVGSPPPCFELSALQHVVGATVDFGGGHAAPGLRYLHSRYSQGACYPYQHGDTAWAEYGVDLRALDFDAAAAYAVGRAGLWGGPSGISLEVGGGCGTTFSASRALGFVGAAVSFYYVDFGGSYHFPVDASRPSWLGRLQFMIRIHVPVWQHAARLRSYPAPRR